MQGEDFSAVHSVDPLASSQQSVVHSRRPARHAFQQSSRIARGDPHVRRYLDPESSIWTSPGPIIAIEPPCHDVGLGADDIFGAD
jgi:hypothetical protein